MAKQFSKKNQSQEIARVAQARAHPHPPNRKGKLVLLQAIVIATAVLWIFWPALHGDWLWDDDQLITNNDVIHDPSGLWKIWFVPPDNLADYYPIKISVEWLEWQLWQGNTFGYHLVNIALHILNALLVWRLFSKFNLRYAWLGGLLFAIHPVMVESVAWIAELKNTLSLPSFLLAMGAFMDYANNGRRKDYFLALGLFLVAMLCKTTMVMFPIVILLYAWWKRGWIGISDLKASTPFFAISLGLGLVTVWLLQNHIIGQENIPVGGFFARLALIGTSVAFYFAQCFWPVGLLPMYPKWTVDPPLPVQFLPWLTFAGIIYWFWTKKAGWGRHALLGLGFFLINLLPFTGFITGSYMRSTWVMDHFLYVPLIGLIGLTIAGMEQIRKQLPILVRSAGIGMMTMAMALLAWESHGYAGLYIDQETLSRYTLRYNPQALPAHQSLGYACLVTGRLEEAMGQFQEVLKMDPDNLDAHCNLGIVLFYMHRIPEAIEQYELVLQLHPHDPETQGNLGVALLQAGRIPEAIEHLKAALAINPNLPGVGEKLEETLRLQEASSVKK